MRAVWLVITAGVASFAAGSFACTAGSGSDAYKADPGEVRVPEPSPDGGADAGPAELDAGPCSDCEYFPATCSPDAFCPNVPFDADDPNSFDPRTTINVIRGRSKTDVWAAGAVGALAHFDGASWTRSDSARQEAMLGLWLPTGTEVAITGELSRVFARGVDAPDGGSPPSPGGWTVHAPVFSPPTAVPRGSVGGSWALPGAESFWYATTTLSGTLWRLRLTPSGAFTGAAGITTSACITAGCSSISSIHGATSNELWAVGGRGRTVRITDAEGATPVARPFDSQTLNGLNGVWEASASDAWAVGGAGTIRHYTGDSRWEIVSDVPTTANLNAVWGFSSSDVWAVGDSGVVLHYDGVRWSQVKVAGLGSVRPDLRTVWGAEPGHVWIGGQGVILSLGGTP